MNPSQQHAEHAKKILERRAGNKSNDKPAVDDTETDPYEGVSVKELRKLCTEKGVEFKKKDTIATLIGKLEA